MIRAIISTFDALVKVSVDLAHQRVTSQVIDEARGIYFGLTRYGNKILLAARNLDVNRIRKASALPTNTIYLLKSGTLQMDPIIRHECLCDLHQLRVMKQWVCVVLGEGSKIAVFEGGSWQLTREIDIAAHVPFYMRHDGPERHELDCYHFNSIFFYEDRIFLLAHNWDHGSFAMECRYSIDKRGPHDLRLIKVYEGLGFEAHDIALYDGTLYVLDSRNGMIIARERSERRVSLPNEGCRPFPRGLSVTRDYLLVCYGYWSTERSDRSNSATRLYVLDRRSLYPIMDLKIGSYGNSCDILVISEEDFSDGLKRKCNWQECIRRLFTCD